MIMKRYIAPWIAVMAIVLPGVISLYGQSVNITGRVVDNDGLPVSQARVRLVLAGIESLTDAGGRFTLFQDNTGFMDPFFNTPNIVFDGRGLYLHCNGEEAEAAIFDLSGRKIFQVLSPRELTGSFVIFPGSYLDPRTSSMYLLRVKAGNDLQSFMFVPFTAVREERGLFPAAPSAGRTKSVENTCEVLDTMEITHQDFAVKWIPVNCHICAFSDITISLKTPRAPDNLSGNAVNASSVSISWSDHSENESGFRIERAMYQVMEWSDFSQIAEVPANATSYTDQGLSQSTTYKYRVCAFNSGGNSDYTEAFTVTTQVANPITLTGPSSSTGEFSLEVTYSWPGMFGSSSDRFELEESTSPTDGFTKIANSPWGQRPQSYTFNLSKTTGTYYYRARAYNTSGFTGYTDVAGVSVNTPVQNAMLKVVNATHYPMIDIRMNGQQLVGQGNALLQGMEYTFEFTGSGSVNFQLGVGYWDGSYRDVWFTLTGNTSVTVGTTTTVTFNNPTIAQLLTGFSTFRDWSGEYWDANLNMHFATFRFFSDGTWALYDDNVQISSGTVSLVSWEDNAVFVYFNLCNGCEAIQLSYPFGQFYYRNGPPSWPTIQYTAQ